MTYLMLRPNETARWQVVAVIESIETSRSFGRHVVPNCDVRLTCIDAGDAFGTLQAVFQHADVFDVLTVPRDLNDTADVLMVRGAFACAVEMLRDRADGISNKLRCAVALQAREAEWLTGREKQDRWIEYRQAARRFERGAAPMPTTTATAPRASPDDAATITQRVVVPARRRFIKLDDT